MKKSLVLLVVSGILLAMTAAESVFTVPDGWPTPSYDFSMNPPDERKIELGRRLFY
ncbi:MAG: hypothetical protein RL021_2017, partial [Bacteroidota bacterium]